MYTTACHESPCITVVRTSYCCEEGCGIDYHQGLRIFSLSLPVATEFASFLYFTYNKLLSKVLCTFVYAHSDIIIKYLLGSLVVDGRKNAYSGEEGTAERTEEKRSRR